jgi:hypothetical protein
MENEIVTFDNKCIDVPSELSFLLNPGFIRGVVTKLNSDGTVLVHVIEHADEDLEETYFTLEPRFLRVVGETLSVTTEKINFGTVSHSPIKEISELERLLITGII